MSIPETIVRWRSSRWFIPAVASSVLLVLLLLAALLIPRLIDLESSRGLIIAQIEKQLDRKVTLGDLSFRLLPSVEVRAERVTIADDPEFAATNFVTAESVRLEVGLWSLLRGQPQLRGMTLEAPSIVLIRAARDTGPRWNWESLRPLREPKTGDEAPPLDLKVSGGSFTLIDRLPDGQVAESSYRGIDIALDDFSPRRSFQYALAVTMPGNGEPDGQLPDGRLQIQGRLGPIVTSDLAQTPLEARLKMDQVALAALEALTSQGAPAAGRRSGELTLDVELAGRLAETLEAKGTLQAANLRLVADDQVAPARTPLELKFELAASSPPPTATGRRIDLQITKGEIALGATRVALTGRLGLGGDLPFDLSLNGQEISLASLLESAPAFGFGPPAGTKASGTASLALRIHRQDGSAATPAIEGQSVIRDLRFESASLPQAIEVTQLRLDATPEQLTIAPFRTILGTRTTVDIARLGIASYRLEPRLTFEAGTTQAQLDDLLKIAESFGLRPNLAANGLVTLRAAGEARLAPGGPVLTRLSGSGRLSGATIKPGQLSRPVEVANVDLAFSGESARLENLALKIGSSDVAGWVQVRNFNQPALGFDLRAGRLSVPEIQSLLVDQPTTSRSTSMTGLSAEGKVAIGHLILDGLTADNLQARLVLRDQILTLDPLTLALYGGSYRGSVRLDQRNSFTDLALRGQLAGVDVNQFLSASGKQSMLYGRLDGSFDLRGRRNPGDGADLASNLLGTGQIQISDGRITSFDLMKQVEVVGKLFNLPTGGAGTVFRLLKTNLRFEPGQVRTDALQLVMNDLTATGEGLVRTGDPGALQYSILARLSPALTRRLVSGRADAAVTSPAETGVARQSGGLGGLFTAFFLEKDSFVIPLKISGPLTGPSFGLDTATLQKRASSSLIESFGQKIFGRKDQDDSPDAKPSTDPSTDPARKKPSPQETIRGILDRLKKKPEKQP